MRRTHPGLPVVLLAALLAAGCQGSFGLTSRIEAPQLVSPPDGAAVECVAVPPTPSPTPTPGPSPTPTPTATPQFFFTWTAVQGVDAYVLEIYTSAGVLVANPRIQPGEARTITLLCGRDYLWRVAAIATYPASPAFSGLRRFTLLPSVTGSAQGSIFVRAP